jgi:SAM-dependent methyltransferase
LDDRLVQHLAGWGLRRFDTDAAYFQWQRDTLSAADLRTLTRLVELKRASQGDPAADTAFYDLAAAPRILPILYSQRYDYYLTVGPPIAERIGRGAAIRSVLDFGCGVGVLTTFYAQRYPDILFVGLDRSPASIATAQAHAGRLGLKNVRFATLDVEREPIGGRYDLLISTHALVQAEQEPGLPSRHWRTFEREMDAAAQSAFEARTGLGIRLDRLCAALAPAGRAVVFEKTRLLARRIPFQRALAARGLTLLEDPLPLRYLLVEEVAEDGPLYVLGRAAAQGVQGRLAVWNETPEELAGQDLYRCQGAAATAVWERLPLRIPAWEGRWQDAELGAIQAEGGSCLARFEYLYLTVSGEGRGLLLQPRREHAGLESGFRRVVAAGGRGGFRFAPLLEETWPTSSQAEDPLQAPLYENHSPAAMEAWAALPDREVLREHAFEEPESPRGHLELGRAPGVAYLYWATVFDQRQIVIVEPARAGLLEAYYDELLAGRPG